VDDRSGIQRRHLAPLPPVVTRLSLDGHRLAMERQRTPCRYIEHLHHVFLDVLALAFSRK
jgi:hypothetical protein